MGGILDLEGRKMCQVDGQKPGASHRTSRKLSKPGTGCRMSGTRDGLWKTREAGG